MTEAAGPPPARAGSAGPGPVGPPAPPATSGASTHGAGPTTRTATGPAELAVAATPSAAEQPPAAIGGPVRADDAARPRRRRARRVLASGAVVLLVLLLGATGAMAVHLYRTTTAWQERSEEYLTDARRLGDDLAGTRAELSGTRAELDAVREQLDTARARIVALADEKAQVGDDREVQRQLVDYQQRVSEAAGQVALALDQCVQGQQELIGYLQSTVDGTAQYDPADLERFRTDVEGLCQAATEANIALQRELAR